MIDIRTGYDSELYDSAGKAVRTQVSNLHNDISEIHNELKNKIDIVYGLTNVIVPIHNRTIGATGENTMDINYNDNGSIHVNCHHSSGNYGFGLLLSETYLKFKNKKLKLIFKTDFQNLNDDYFVCKEYIADNSWGGKYHKDDIIMPGIISEGASPVSHKELFRKVPQADVVYEQIVDMSSNLFNDNDDIAILFDLRFIGDFSFDLIIYDISDILELPQPEEDPLDLSHLGYIQLKNLNIFKDFIYKYRGGNAPTGTAANVPKSILPDENRFECSSDGYKIKLKLKPLIIQNIYNEQTDCWIYGGISIKLNEFLNLNYKFDISIRKINGTGNNVFNVFNIGDHQLSWSTTYNILNKHLLNDGSNIFLSFNTLTDIISEIDSENDYWLNIAYDVRTLQNNENNFVFDNFDCDIEIDIRVFDIDNTEILSTKLVDFDKSDYYTKNEVDALINIPDKYITCWGDSLTAGGGWTSRLQELTGMTVYNAGVGGESSSTICARQGGDGIIVNNLIIPPDTSEILIASKNTDHGLLTVENKRVTPLLQGSSVNGTHFNPCKIGDIEGTLRWTGSNYADTTGTWVFKRSEAGEAVTINRPTILRTNYDMNKNNPYLMVIFIGQNSGWSTFDELVRQHRLMIEHANAEHVIILGLSSGNASGRADYETRMKQEFGRYFISLREYLSTPIYENGEIVSCYGIEDQDAEIDMDYISLNANNLTVKQEIEQGIVPHAILADGVHYTTGTKTVIGDLIYKRCKELNIF